MICLSENFSPISGFLNSLFNIRAPEGSMVELGSSSDENLTPNLSPEDVLTETRRFRQSKASEFSSPEGYRENEENPEESSPR